MLGDRQVGGRSPSAACSVIKAPAGRLSVHDQISHNISNRRRAFSLLELLIVIAVTVVLAGLLFPALANLRENAYRVVCGSNQRQIGMAMMMYERDTGELPLASQLTRRESNPRDLVLAHLGGNQKNWDGVGRLFAFGYCRSPNCYYCPSHKGEHRIDRELDDWYFLSGEPIYTNFHYCGHIDWVTNQPRDLARSIQADKRLVLLTDSLVSRDSLNHEDGMNMLMGDGSVRWRNSIDDIDDYLPLRDEQSLTNAQEADYREIWSIIENSNPSGL